MKRWKNLVSGAKGREAKGKRFSRSSEVPLTVTSSSHWRQGEDGAEFHIDLLAGVSLLLPCSQLPFSTASSAWGEQNAQTVPGVRAHQPAGTQGTHTTSCSKPRAVWPAGIYCFPTCWLITCNCLPSLPGDVFQRLMLWEMWAAPVITHCCHDRWEFQAQPHSSHRTKTFQLPSPHETHGIAWLGMVGMARGNVNGLPHHPPKRAIHPLSRKTNLGLGTAGKSPFFLSSLLCIFSLAPSHSSAGEDNHYFLI